MLFTAERVERRERAPQRPAAAPCLPLPRGPRALTPPVAAARVSPLSGPPAVALSPSLRRGPYGGIRVALAPRAARSRILVPETMRTRDERALAGVAQAASPTATTKLVPPVAPASLLRRERLLARLDEALERRLTIVVADAGFGKSTLLADWATRVNCAWYSASPEDASLATFARGVVDALRLRVPAVPTEIAGAVAGAGGSGAETDEPARARSVAALVCEALQTALRRDLVLVVDDAHEVAARSRRGAADRGALPPGAGPVPRRARVTVGAFLPDRAPARAGPGARAARARPRLRRRGDRSSARDIGG